MFWPHTLNPADTLGLTPETVVHIVIYIVILLCANLISSHVQILGCTYAISMSACGVQPLAVAHHLNVKYMCNA